MHKPLTFLLAVAVVPSAAAMSTHPRIVAEAATVDSFPLVGRTGAATLVVDANDFKGVRHAVDDLKADLARVTGREATISEDPTAGGFRVVIGTIGHHKTIDHLVASRRLDVSAIANRWEAYLIQRVGPDLVVAGSDKRGTIYGVYELCEQIGVSPWVWWADVPVTPRKELHVTGAITDTGPIVQYRGIFLNDEAPALTGWVHEKFGAFDHTFYVHVFELLLRLRANYLWPAMWQPRAFSADDPLNPKLADEYGIVIGTSHHEPLMRAHDEWSREGEGPWDYSRNAANLRAFWRGGVERAKPYESLYTIGMRGDGDSAMSAETNTALLERIVADQRRILAEVLGRPADTVPQLWALYKEVQGYYEAGMRVPDDVILLWCDDNWGNIRRLPRPEEMKRPGGAGVYYHFDYVGGPRNYKWIDVQPISKVWEQMHLAWQYQANRIWIVNVGDLKPMEFPIEFFLTMAWDPAAMDVRALQGYTSRWAAREFGAEHADEIAALVDGYTKLNRHRTPEMMSPDTYSLTSYDEAERILAQWRDLVARAEAVAAALPDAEQAAFFELVYYPVAASATVREVHIAAARNALYAEQGRAKAANEAAAHLQAMARRDADLKARYHALLGGKWNHMMDEKKFGYTYWQTPPAEVLPAVAEVRPESGPAVGLAVDGSRFASPRWGLPPLQTPVIDVYGESTTWVELFSRGDAPVQFQVKPGATWLEVSPASGTLTDMVRLTVAADWRQVPVGTTETDFTIDVTAPREPDPRDASTAAFSSETNFAEHYTVKVPIVNPADLRPGDFAGHVEVNGYVAIEAPHASRTVGAGTIQWQTLEGFGRTLGGVMSIPVRAEAEQPGGGSSRLEYDFHARTTGEVQLEVHTAPTLDYQSDGGPRFAVSIDDGAPQVLALDTWKTLQTWEKAVGEGVTKVTTTVSIAAPGKHTLKIWRVTPGVVFERFILGNAATQRSHGRGLLPSYLGPPESPRGGGRKPRSDRPDAHDS
jgi:hypothetical protein